MASNDEITIFIQDTAGERFECTVPRDTPLRKLAADFFEDHAWPTRDADGRAQRAVVDLVDPDNPNRTKRLRGESSIEDAGLWEGATLRIFPEAIAGAVDQRDRIAALVADHRDITELSEWNEQVRFEANAEHAPTRYTVTLTCPSFSAISADGHTPIRSAEQQMEIMMPADYPRGAPRVRWLTQMFHPNVRADDGAVCLGVLMHRYLPGYGLARLVTMLAEMAQYRNYDSSNALNRDAAMWADNPEHWEHIFAIGGSPFQGPIEEFLGELERESRGSERERLRFRNVRTSGAPT